MADPFIGELRLFSYAGVPRGWATCAGQLLPINQNQALFSLLGVAFGGDGVQTFLLPDLRGRSPAGAVVSTDPSWQPPVYPWGAVGGVEQVSLTSNQNGPHTHGLTATTDMGVSTFVDGPYVLAQAASPGLFYGGPQNLVPLGGGPSSIAGGGAPHDNMQPYEVINFNIALSGIYPSRS